MQYSKQGHCVYYAQYHMVLASKYRKKIFNEGVLEYLKDILKRIADYYPEISITEINSDFDHIHLLVSIPPKIAVSKAVMLIKANTAKALKEKFPFLKRAYFGTDGIWSDGYFVSTVGIDEEVIKKYIINQGREDSGQAKLGL
jgi:putative transposase